VSDSYKQAILDCDFSKLLARFRIGDLMPPGLSDLIAIKSRLKREETNGERRARLLKRIERAAASHNLDAVREAIAAFEGVGK
jgi:hypothetical protein